MGVLRLDASGTVRTVTSIQAVTIAGILAAPDNRSLIVVADGDAIAVSPNGALTTVASALPQALLLDVDGDGQVIAAGARAGGAVLFSIDARGASTLGVYPVWPGVMHHDTTSGDVLLSNGGLFALGYRGPTSTSTLTAAQPFDRPPTWSPETGSLIGGTGGGSALARLDRTTLGVTPLGVGPLLVGGVCRTPSGRIAVADHVGRVVTEVDPVSGATLRVLVRGLRAELLTYAQSRHLAGTGIAGRGTNWPARVSFPTEPGSGYASAVSFGIGAGWSVGGSARLFLVPDRLFALSLVAGPPLFVGFRGALDARGEATLGLFIPPLAPPGLRIFAQAAVIRGGGIVAVSLPIGVTIR